MEKFKLPKSFAEKFVIALRDKSNKDFTPKVVANKIDKKISSEFLHGHNGMYPPMLHKFLENGNYGVANWIEQYIDFI
jgi:hypothetical protein